MGEGSSARRRFESARSRMERLSDWIEGQSLMRSNEDEAHQPDLTAALMRQMRDTLDERLADLAERADRIREQLNADLLAEDTARMEERQDQFRLLRQEFEDVAERRRALDASLQERIVEDGLVGLLGSRTAFRRFEMLIVALTGLVLLILAWETMGAPRHLLVWLWAADFSCCLVFLAEFAFRYRAAEDRRWFVRNNWVDLVAAIPVPPAAFLSGAGWAPLVRVGRVFRALRLLRVLRLLRGLALLWRGMERLSRVADVTLMRKSLYWLLAIWLAGSLALLPEQGRIADAGSPPATEVVPNAPVPAAEGAGIDIDDPRERLWWSATTLVTQGYADIHNPTVGVSRVFTMLLVVSGIIIVGVFTATLTSVYVGEEAEHMRLVQQALSERLTRIEEMLSDDGGP